jgi:hypothetical protein
MWTCSRSTGPESEVWRSAELDLWKMILGRVDIATSEGILQVSRRSAVIIVVLV